MATNVRFEPAGYTCEVEAGTRLVDVTDAHPGAKVPYSCRSASCGTCRVRVEAGAEAMAPAEDDELEVLDAFGNEPGVRLSCQLRLAHDVPQVVLRVVDPD
ncbi:MAG: 2Fe-2S iron-sulfur cluster-binding protein [Polyangiales bacterium]